jgi:hypothetical protein
MTKWWAAIACLASFAALVAACEAVPALTFEDAGDDSGGDSGGAFDAATDAACPATPPPGMVCCGAVACATANTASQCTGLCNLCSQCTGAGQFCCAKMNSVACLNAGEKCH